MAITATVTTQYGEDRECYIRLNNMEVSNHGLPAQALFRGFLSREAFKAGAHYVWETSVEFDADVSQPLWAQAYHRLAEQESIDDIVEV